jgi:hypothetical protein
MMAHPTATMTTERTHRRILPTTAPRRALTRPVTRRRTCLRTIIVFSLLRRTIAAARRALMGQLTSSSRVEWRRNSAGQDVASD